MDNKELFLKLLHCNTYQHVEELLIKENYWNDKNAWRIYGDSESNMKDVGNQQGASIKSLAEKVTNRADALLTSKCYEHDIDPKDRKLAPKSIREAVTKFYVNPNSKDYEEDGNISFWQNSFTREIANTSSIWATQENRNSNLCINIADTGEGQTPKSMHDTLLSLGKGNKQRIFFVQGTFNMGGSGAISFCEGYCQLIISKRNPNIADKFNGESNTDDDHWSFTVTRRERPQQDYDGFEEAKSSIITYLAPINSSSSPRKGSLLTFKADKLPIFPGRTDKETNPDYAREVEWGTLVKLYEYSGLKKGHTLRGGGLKDELELVMPDAVLPMRIHETRKSFISDRDQSTSFRGLLARFDKTSDYSEKDSLENISPQSEVFYVDGQQFNLKYFAAKKGKMDFIKSRGVIYSYNGQSHYELPNSFFTRKLIKLHGIKESAIVVLDCSKIDYAHREDLFMANRDGLKKDLDFSKEIENMLVNAVANHQGYRELVERRKSEQIADELKDDKPMENIMAKIIKNNKNFASIFTPGAKLFARMGTKAVGLTKGKYEGKAHPSFFYNFRTKNDKSFKNTFPKNKKIHIKFETDVENDYFDRSKYKGKLDVEYDFADKIGRKLKNYNYNTSDGILSFSAEWPVDLEPGQEVKLRFHLFDKTGVSFKINGVIKALSAVTPKKNTKTRNPHNTRTKEDKKPGGTGSKRNVKEEGLNFPTILWKTKEEEGFDDYDVVKVYDDDLWFLNKENTYFLTEIDEIKKRRSTVDIKAFEEQYRVFNVLAGLSQKYIYENHTKHKKNEDTDANSAIEIHLKGLAPVARAMMSDVQQIARGLTSDSEEFDIED